MHKFYTPHPEILYLKEEYNKVKIELTKKNPSFVLQNYEGLEAELTHYKQENKRLVEENKELKKQLNLSNYLFSPYMQPELIDTPYKFDSINIPFVSEVEAKLDKVSNAWHLMGMCKSKDNNALYLRYYISDLNLHHNPQNALYYTLEKMSHILSESFDAQPFKVKSKEKK